MYIPMTGTQRSLVNFFTPIVLYSMVTTIVLVFATTIKPKKIMFQITGLSATIAIISIAFLILSSGILGGLK